MNYYLTCSTCSLCTFKAHLHKIVMAYFLQSMDCRHIRHTLSWNVTLKGLLLFNKCYFQNVCTVEKWSFSRCVNCWTKIIQNLFVQVNCVFAQYYLNLLSYAVWRWYPLYFRCDWSVDFQLQLKGFHQRDTSCSGWHRFEHFLPSL